jgi:BirA family biotin operon repressor/biotin-[acetyl-CoA-carboxylase] ligase
VPGRTGALRSGYHRTMNDLDCNVLRWLGDGCFHSGQALAARAGMSRASVWHAVRRLGAQGIVIYRVPGRGYRLREPLYLLDEAALDIRARQFDPPLAVRVLRQTPSTNTLLMQEAATGAAHGTVVTAEHQTGGRGRQGRTWVAPIAGGLTFSLLWRFCKGAGELSGLSLAVGVALVRGLRSLGAPVVALKWPNDVLADGRKLAGILIEVQGEAFGPSAAVIGVGVNVRLGDDHRAAIDQPVTDLETLVGHPVNRNEALMVLLEALHRVLVDFDREGFSAFRDEWRACHAHERQGVIVFMPDGSQLSGVADGVATDGALLINTPNGVRRLHGGEVSLRADRSNSGGRS